MAFGERFAVDIERVEFPAAAVAPGDNGAASAEAPPRDHFVGKWENAAIGNGSDFYITLKESGDAIRSIEMNTAAGPM